MECCGQSQLWYHCASLGVSHVQVPAKQANSRQTYLECAIFQSRARTPFVRATALTSRIRKGP